MLEKMPTMVLFSSFFFFSFLGLTSAGQETIQHLKLDERVIGGSHSDLSVAVSVSDGELQELASNVLMAESWLRTYVLAQYPSTKISTIIVGNTILCHNHQKNKLHFILLSLKNLFHSLTRWGLEKDIKISTSFSNDCFHEQETFDEILRLVIQFIHSTNSTITLKLPHEVSDETAHLESMKKFGFLEFSQVNVILNNPEERNSISRKLSFAVSNFEDEYRESSNLSPTMAEPPFPSLGFSVPSSIATHPHPPQSQIGSPPLFSPCNPNENANAPFTQTGGVQKLWCVAKPSVPAEILQQAMDYACGDGGADCKEISSNGSCFLPDTLVAHASYAFNSYWQKNKRNGGTCSFGGTAMIINSDPSFHRCRFVLS